MITAPPVNPDLAHILWVSCKGCPCDRVHSLSLKCEGRSRGRGSLGVGWKDGNSSLCCLLGLGSGRSRRNGGILGGKRVFRVCAVPSDGSGGGQNVDVGIAYSARLGTKNIAVKRFSSEVDGSDKKGLSQEVDKKSVQVGSKFANFREDPIVDKLRGQLGVIHPIPSPPMNRNIFGFFVLFFFIGVVSDKIWTRLKRKKSETQLALWRQSPTSLSMFLEKDLQRKESVEWVNMVLGKFWKVYRPGLENWIIGLLQPVIDNLQKPDYVQRVEVKQFSLGDEPISVRSVERRTSRRVNDLQYQIGLRYTGGARMLLMLSLKFGVLPVVVPVGVRDFDIDGELWVKLRLIPTEPWVGAVQWAFVSLPKIKFELSPFRLFNLMTIPVLSTFLTKLLTEDLPKLFVRPKKIVLDFQKGQAVGPVPVDPKTADVQEKNKDFVGELSVTLVDARDLSYLLYGKTDPYVVLRLGDQIIRSKKNSQTTVIGPPGQPIWNQDFHMLVADPKKQILYIEIIDSLGFADISIGTGEVDLGALQDTVPTDKIVVLTGGWNLLRKRRSGEALLRLTYKAYVEDEEDEGAKSNVAYKEVSEDDGSDSDEADLTYKQMQEGPMREADKESFMDVLAALLVSEEFRGIVASEAGNNKVEDEIKNSGSTTPRPRSPAPETISPTGGSDSSGFTGSPLFWLAVITTLAVIIALNVGGSSIFNP